MHPGQKQGHLKRKEIELSSAFWTAIVYIKRQMSPKKENMSLEFYIQPNYPLSWKYPENLPRLFNISGNNITIRFPWGIY